MMGKIFHLALFCTNACSQQQRANPPFQFSIDCRTDSHKLVIQQALYYANKLRDCLLSHEERSKKNMYKINKVNN
jgi:hypothetical protein